MSELRPRSNAGQPPGSEADTAALAHGGPLASSSNTDSPGDVASAVRIGARVLVAQAAALLVYCVVVVAKKPQYTNHPSAHSEQVVATVIFGILPAMAAGVLAALGRRADRGLRGGSHASTIAFALSLAGFALLMVYSYPTGPEGAEIGVLIAFAVLSVIEVIAALIASVASPGSATRPRRDSLVAVACGVVVGSFTALTGWSWLQEFFPSLT